jgi:hypothetical protein
VDNVGNALTWNGTSWSQPVSIDPNTGSLPSVSCPSATFCVAVDDFDAFTWNGTSWSQPVSIDLGGNAYLNSVSCASATFCVAVDESGDAVIGRS